jgi:GTP-binding protein HflX
MKQKKEKAIIIHVIPHDVDKKEAHKDLAELVRLVETYGGVVILEVIQKRGRVSAKTYVGKGKIFEVAEAVKELGADIVIVNEILRPNQILHLSKTMPKGTKVWDRTDIILKIFDKHAEGQEAKLEIKLAQYRHDIPKIYARHATTLFERERGGIGATRGAGERGIEQEKRHIRAQIKELEKKIDQIKKVRANQRKRRKRSGLPTIALVGYTNAGKSSLLTALTKKEGVYEADELFATLDTKIGNLWLPDLQRSVLVADTIGFIQNLPPFLIASFKATLEEVQESALLLHIIDSADEEMFAKIQVVHEILEEIECIDKPMIYVFNKADLNKNIVRKLRSLKTDSPYAVVSAHKGEGLDELKKLIAENTSFDL